MEQGLLTNIGVGGTRVRAGLELQYLSLNVGRLAVKVGVDEDDLLRSGTLHTIAYWVDDEAGKTLLIGKLCRIGKSINELEGWPFALVIQRSDSPDLYDRLKPSLTAAQVRDLCNDQFCRSFGLATFVAGWSKAPSRLASSWLYHCIAKGEFLFMPPPLL